MDYQSEINLLKNQIRHQRKMTQVSIVASLLACSGILLGAYQSTHINQLSVNRLAVIDANGVERVILESDNHVVNVPSGVQQRKPKMSGIILQNPKGHEVGGFGSGDNGMAVMMLDSYSDKVEHGATERIGMYTMPNGEAALRLVDLQSELRSELKSNADGEVKFWVK